MAAGKKSAPKRFRILALDGGGIRGIIPAVWLAELEAELRKTRKDALLRDHFDLVAGTSTGAILACLVATGTPAADMPALYEEFGREVFPSTASRLWSRARRLFSQGPSAPKYDDRGLERALRRRFGDTRFGDLPGRTLVTAYDTLAREGVVMKNFGADGTPPGHFDEVPLWEVAKASSSAPTYFPAHLLAYRGVRMPLIDGGVVANNPTVCAVAEGVRIQGAQPARKRVKLEQFLVASLGTGQLNRPISAEDAREWGALEWAVPIIDVLFDGAGDATHYAARHLLPEARYFRLQTPLDDAFDDLDDASATNLNALRRIALERLMSGGGRKTLAAIAAAIA